MGQDAVLVQEGTHHVQGDVAFEHPLQVGDQVAPRLAGAEALHVGADRVGEGGKLQADHQPFAAHLAEAVAAVAESAEAFEDLSAACLGVGGQGFVAEDLQREVLCLPSSPGLAVADLERVVGAIRASAAPALGRAAAQ